MPGKTQQNCMTCGKEISPCTRGDCAGCQARSSATVDNAEQEKIEQCRCGKNAIIIGDSPEHGYMARCVDDDCWFGPTTNTRGKSIEAWNDVMKTVEGTRK